MDLLTELPNSLSHTAELLPASYEAWQVGPFFLSKGGFNVPFGRYARIG